MGSSVKREVELRIPQTAQTGRSITLTLTVHAEDSPDSNYAVVHLIVIPEVRNITVFYNEEGSRFRARSNFFGVLFSPSFCVGFSQNPNTWMRIGDTIKSVGLSENVNVYHLMD